MFSATLIVGYEDQAQIALDAETLVTILCCLPDSECTSDFLETLSQIPWESVRTELASKQNLTPDILATLTLDPHMSVPRALADNRAALEKMNSEQVRRLIATDDYEVLSSLSRNLDFGSRDDSARAFFELANHPDPAIRKLVAEVSDADWAVLETLSSDSDPGVKRSAQCSLQERTGRIVDTDRF